MGDTLSDIPFEPALARLEEIVTRLEDGSLALDDSLALFEEGVGLSRRCIGLLREAEQKVEQLNLASGETSPFGDAPDVTGTMAAADTREATDA